jgi:hypothetical protein
VKGVILTSFLGWVEATRGLVVTDAMLVDAEPSLSTGGAYTSVGNYPASELSALAACLAAHEGVTSADILREFGIAAFPQLGALHPSWLEGMDDLYALLSRIEGVIHTEVRKLYSDAQPPLITAEKEQDGTIRVTYASHRDLVPLCQGLIEGAALHFGEDCDVDVVSVVREGDITRAVMEVRASDHG